MRFPDRRSVTLDLIAPLLVSSLFFFLLLGHLPLGDWDEAIYADIAREFVHGPSRLIPYWNFHPWLERTPLFEWTTAGLFAVFGVSEFWARAASALSGVGTALVTYAMAMQMGGRRLAWIAFTVLITTHGFFYQARFGTTDIMLTLWMAVSLFGICRVSSGDARGWYLFWFGLALGIMTKSAGPAPIVLTAILFAIKERWSLRILGRAFSVGLALCILIVAPWHVYMIVRFGSTFLNEYFGRQLLSRGTQALEGHTGSPAFYLVTIAKSAFPWSLFVFWAAVQALRRRQLQLMGLYALVLLCFYSLIGTKLPWYITPIYPALAIIAAQQIEELRPDHFPAKTTAAALGLVLTLALIGLLAVDLRRPVRREVLLIKSHDLHQYEAPLILCSESFIPDLPAPVFYAGEPVVQAYLTTKPNRVEGQGKIDPATNDLKFRNPRPLAQFVSTSPHPILVERKLVPELVGRFRFHEIAADAKYVLGTVETH